MLSDHEREALRELERQFTAEPDSLRLFAPRPVYRRHLGPSGTLLIMAGACNVLAVSSALDLRKGESEA